MISLRGSPRRYVVHMTSSGGGIADLTHDLAWDEASETLRVLREFFADSGAMAEGWSISDIDGGFSAANERVSVTFTVTTRDESDEAETGHEDLIGRGRATGRPKPG